MVGAFNVGVEGAQFVATLCAIPLLMFSRWRGYDAILVLSMVVTCVVAVVWIVERMRGIA